MIDMKKYTAPNMTVSRFMTENIITTSSGTDTETAVDKINSKMANSEYTAVVKFTL